MSLQHIVKRDGSTAPFDVERIVIAIERAQLAVGIDDRDLADELAQVVVEQLERTIEDGCPNIEDVQDSVIYVLQESGNYEVALAYMRYRDARERLRRQRRLSGEDRSSPNLVVVGRDGRQRQWDAALLRAHLMDRLELSDKAAEDVILQVEETLAQSSLTRLTAPALLSLVDAALVRCGFNVATEHRVPLRLDRELIRACLEPGSGGDQAVYKAGEAVLNQLSVTELMPEQVVHLYSSGRLWVDGLGDPLRGSAYTAGLDGNANPWQIIAQAYSEAVSAKSHWRQVRLVMPPIIIGHLERGAVGLLEPLEHLAELAEVYLYCDGRTPLLDDWPFASKRISIASYAEDFLILRRLQELGLEYQSGPHLMQGGYRRRVAAKLALNAQGLEEQFTQMDHLAMGLVAAAKMRQQQAAKNPALAGADIRYAIFGLPPNSSSSEYLERQIVQEGLRSGVALSRTTNLPADACQHLGRLFT